MRHRGRATPIAMAVLSAMLGPAALADDRVDGSGVVVSDARETAAFSAIRFTTVGRLAVEQTGRDRVVVRAEDNIAPLLLTEIREGTLVIGAVPGRAFRATRPVEILVEMRTLRALDVSGSGHVELSTVAADRLEVTHRGAGNIAAAGRVGRLRVGLVGAGSFDGGALAADHAAVELRGAGNVVVHAVRSLDVAVSGSGTVDYIGEPSVTQAITGAGKVRKRDRPPA